MLKLFLVTVLVEGSRLAEINVTIQKKNRPKFSQENVRDDHPHHKVNDLPKQKESRDSGPTGFLCACRAAFNMYFHKSVNKPSFELTSCCAGAQTINKTCSSRHLHSHNIIRLSCSPQAVLEFKTSPASSLQLL